MNERRCRVSREWFCSSGCLLYQDTWGDSMGGSVQGIKNPFWAFPKWQFVWHSGLGQQGWRQTRLEQLVVGKEVRTPGLPACSHSGLPACSQPCPTRALWWDLPGKPQPSLLLGRAHSLTLELSKCSPGHSTVLK